MDRVLLRFSDMGYVAVATLLGSGLFNNLAMFAGMLALAATNRFWLVPSMSRPRTDGSDRSTAWTGRLRDHVLGEQFLGLMVLLIVSVLGTMRPAADQ